MNSAAGLRAAAAVALALAVAGCAQDPRQERIALGKEVYTRECSRCHLISGKGYPGVYPNLDRNPIVPTSMRRATSATRTTTTTPSRTSPTSVPSSPGGPATAVRALRVP